jgi:hypothetical protein
LLLPKKGTSRPENTSLPVVIRVTVIRTEFAHAFAQRSGIDEGSMTRDEFDTLGIASHCRRPDPVECSERQTSYAQSGDEICLRCPVASWVTAMVVSGAGTNAEADWSDADWLEREDNLVPFPGLAARAA